MALMNRTKRQIEASRNNGRKSNGPMIPRGGRRPGQPPIVTGVAVNSPLLEGEDPVAFQLHLNGFIARLNPQDHMELRLVRKLASIDWRLSRLTAIESGDIDNALALTGASRKTGNPSSYKTGLATAMAKSVDTSRLPHFLASRETSLDRAYNSALRQLQFLRKNHPIPAYNPPSFEMEALIGSQVPAAQPVNNPQSVENAEIENPEGTHDEPAPQV